MDSSLKRRPEGVALSPLAEKVFDLLATYTAFPWPVLATVAQRKGIDLATLSPAGLATIAPFLAQGVERYTSPAKGQLVRVGLAALLRKTSPPSGNERT